MITNDAELEVVRRQLRRAETALEGCRRDFLPGNEVQYRLFAGSTIDLIQSLRAEVDEYLGVGLSADLTISLEGEEVSLGTLSAGVITRIIDTFRRSLQSVVGVLHADFTQGGRPRRSGWIERLCDLSLVGVGPGSVRVFLDFPPSGRSTGDAEGRQLLADAVTTLFDGLEWAAQETESLPSSLLRLPLATRLSLLGVIARLLPPQSGPVERIAYRRRAEGSATQARRASLTRQSHNRVYHAMEQVTADRKVAAVEGVIRQIDLDAQTFVLRERSGNLPDLSCEYPGVLRETVKEMLDRRVKVSGLLETSRVTHRSTLEVEAFELVGDEETAEQALAVEKV